MWGRGLKLKIDCNPFVIMLVAPRVGAWIEIDRNKGEIRIKVVAPRVGAWIEI